MSNALTAGILAALAYHFFTRETRDKVFAFTDLVIAIALTVWSACYLFFK